MQKVQNTEAVFSIYSLQGKRHFIHTFEQVPSIVSMNQISLTKILAFMKEKYKSQVQAVHQVSEYSHTRRKVILTEALIVLDCECMIDLSGSYCEILYTEQQTAFAHQLVHALKRFKETSKKSEFEINLIVTGEDGLTLRSMEIKKTRLNLDLYYEDDFKEVDEKLRKRLNAPKDKGIVLLHGLPGTGKTTYLRFLIGKLKKKVIFVSPEAARHINSPAFLDLLIDNTECILIIEDAENVIQDRQMSHESPVSNLLNISDGLLADFLNIQVICTFNQSLSAIDEALLRKGRLIANYEFKKLSVVKARHLSSVLGIERQVEEPMTLAEITHPDEKSIKSDTGLRKIGFQMLKRAN